MDAGHCLLLIVFVVGVISWAWDHGRQTETIASLFGVVDKHKATIESLVDSGKTQLGVIECYESENKRLREFIAAMHRQSGCIVSEVVDDFEDSETVPF
jgi:IS1 family transposase